jgi:NAD(P)-dependent dehydrogenase (short-subunit alcohol dehydrogenase family)
MNRESKVAVITGASQGIGAGLVAAYRRLGYRVVATSRSVRPTDDPDILSIPGDIGHRKTAEEAISSGLARFGRIDTLVNNAGIFIAKPFTEYTQADYEAMTAVNLSGFFYITQLALGAMEKKQSGHVVQITATLPDHGDSRVRAALASLTKGGLNAVTKALAIEYAASGIRVNAVAPGIIKTPMHAAAAYGALGAMHPVGRMGEISDVVEAVIYFEGALFVTGEILHVDGGLGAGR